MQEQAPRFVSQRFARRWYDIGAKYSNYDSPRAAYLAAYEDGYEVTCWEAAAAFKAGMRGLPFQIKRWQRYGPVPVGRDGWAIPSYNWADSRPEEGVSAIDEAWLSSLRGQISQARRTRELVEFTGLQVGWGSDGEPVVLPVAVD